MEHLRFLKILSLFLWMIPSLSHGSQTIHDCGVSLVSIYGADHKTVTELVTAMKILLKIGLNHTRATLAKVNWTPTASSSEDSSFTPENTPMSGILTISDHPYSTNAAFLSMTLTTRSGQFQGSLRPLLKHSSVDHFEATGLLKDEAKRLALRVHIVLAVPSQPSSEESLPLSNSNLTRILLDPQSSYWLALTHPFDLADEVEPRSFRPPHNVKILEGFLEQDYRAFLTTPKGHSSDSPEKNKWRIFRANHQPSSIQPPLKNR